MNVSNNIKLKLLQVIFCFFVPKSSVLLEFQEIDAKSQIWKQFDSSQTDLCRRMAG